MSQQQHQQQPPLPHTASAAAAAVAARLPHLADNRFARGAAGTAVVVTKTTSTTTSSKTSTATAASSSSSSSAAAEIDYALKSKIAALEGHLTVSEMRLKDAEAQVQELKASALATARENVIKAITTVPPANGTATPGLHPSSSSSGSLSVPRITTTASTTGAGGDLGHGGSELALPSAGGTSPRLVAAPDLPPPSPTGLAAALLPPRPPPRGSSIKIVQRTVVTTSTSQAPTGAPAHIPAVQTNIPALHSPVVVVDLTAELHALRFCLSVLDDNDESAPASDHRFVHARHVDVEAVQKVHENVAAVSQRTDERVGLMREFIAAKEREWIKGTVSQEDDYEGLFFQATRGWAVWNAPPKDLKAYGFGRSDSYKYDFFISYRVASESYLARELRLRLIKLNYKVFLDQENLKDGENWQTGFVTGLKSSRVVLLLVSAAALEPRRVARSVSAVDNVLLEWETAMAAATFGFCAVLPIYVGSGVIDISKYPKDRFKLVERNPGTELFCRQSAFTTLRRLQSIGMRLSLPNPARGFTDDHIGKIAATLKGFNLTFDVTQPKKALLYFQELGEKIFGQEPGGSISKAWFCKDCRIEPVFGDKFSKFHLVMKHNNAWKNFNVSRQVRESGADTGLSALILDDIRKKEPETLTFAWESIQSKDPIDQQEMKAITKALEAAPSIKSLNFSYNFFDDAAARELVRWIKTLPNLDQLYLRSVKSENYSLVAECLRSLVDSRVSVLRVWDSDDSEADLEALSSPKAMHSIQVALNEYLASTKSLKQLKIGYAGDFAPLAEALVQNHSIVQLTFAYAHVTHDVKSFFKAIAHHPTINEVVIYAAPVLVAPCAEFIKHSGSLRKVTLKLKDGDREIVENVWKGVEVNRALTEVHLCIPKDAEPNNFLPMACFPTALRATSTLRVLDFSAFNYAQPCFFDLAGEEMLFEGLRENKTLEVLDLNSCSITAGGALKILEGLMGHPKLFELNMSGLQLTGSSSFMLKGLVTACPNLSILHLNENNLGNKPVLALCQALLQKPILQEVHLDFVQMDATGAKGLAEVLTKTSTLKNLYIEGNEIGWPGAEALAFAAKECQSLTTLQVGFAITKESALQFVDAMAVNTKLSIKMGNMWFAGIVDSKTMELLRFSSMRNAGTVTAANNEALRVFDYMSHFAVPNGPLIINVNEDSSKQTQQEANQPTVKQLKQAVLALANTIQRTSSDLEVFQSAKVAVEKLDAMMNKEKETGTTPTRRMSKVLSKHSSTVKMRKSTERINRRNRPNFGSGSYYVDEHHYTMEATTEDKDSHSGGASSHVAFLTQFSRLSQAQQVETAIIRELTLRLDLESLRVDKKEHSDARQSDNPGGTSPDDDDDSSSETASLNATKTETELTPVVSVATFYKEAHRFIDPNLSEDSLVNGTEFANLYVILISEATVQSVTETRESLMLVLSIWDFLLKSALRKRCNILPIFIGTDIDGFQRKLKFALYKAFESSKTVDSDSVIRGLQVITHLFRLQGIVYTDSGSCKTIIAKILGVLQSFYRTSQKRLERLAEAIEQLPPGMIGSLSEITSQRLLRLESVSEDQVKALAEIIPHLRKAKTAEIFLATRTNDSGEDKLNRDDLPHTMGGLDHIVDGLLDNDSITDVTLWTPRQYRSEQALAKLADCLRSSPWTSLNLTMNFERTTDVADLGDAIGKSQDLRKLSLVGNSKGLRYFRVMDYLGLRAAGIQALSDGLKKNRSIESLDITDNGVDAQGARVLSYALQGHPSLNRLSLAGNSIGMEGAKITIERLCSNDSRLVIIDLSGNNIGSLSDQIFVPVIESNKTLKELHISENKILDTAMISILQALTVNTTITGFSCARNHMTRAVLPSLETLLMKNKTLLTLDISGNPLEDATHLGKSLAANTTLEFVSIENINFADLSGFCENVKGNRSLQEMEVGALGEDLDLQRHVQPLADMMKAMPRLTALSISGGMQAEEVKQVKEAWLSVSGRVAGSLIMDGVEQLDGDKRTDSDEYDDNEEEEDEQDDADSHDGEEPIEAGDEGAVAAPTV